MNRDEWFEKQKMWTSRYYGQLDGATIKELILVVDSEAREIYPTFAVKLANGEELEIEIRRDEEGNGPGFISGLPFPEVKHPHAGNRAYFAELATTLFAKQDAKVIDLPDDDRKHVAVVKVNSDRETVRIGEDPANEGKFLIDLIDGEDHDTEASLVVPNLSEGDLIEMVGDLVEWNNNVTRDGLMLKYAAVLLEDQDAELWHSGGGIMLVAGFYGKHRITVAPDYTEKATFGVEVTHDDDGDSILFKEGLTASQMVNLFSEQRKKYSA